MSFPSARGVLHRTHGLGHIHRRRSSLALLDQYKGCRLKTSQLSAVNGDYDQHKTSRVQRKIDRRSLISRLVAAPFLLPAAAPALADSDYEEFTDPEEVSFSLFLSYLEEGRVLQVDLYDGGYEALFTLFPPDSGNLMEMKRVRLPRGATPELLRAMRQAQVNIAMHQRSESNQLVLQRMLLWLGPPLLLLGSLLFLIFRQGRTMANMSKLRGKVQVEQNTGVTFDDVAGVDEAKQDFMEVVDFLQKPEKFAELGARIPRGCLLVGPPGTGKTLLARAIAGEAGVPFFCVSGSQFVEMFVGVGASRVRELFNRAKAEAPCLLFIDEIDALGRARGGGVGNGSDEREQTLNQLLTEMDGFDGNTGVMVMAATNRADILDPALVRPGRLDRQVSVDVPDHKGRLAILQVHARGKALGQDVPLDALALRTPGLAGADLANLMNEAAILAGRRGKAKISAQEVDDALERIVAGMEGRPLVDGRTKSLVAYHEAGHALCGTLQPGHDPVAKVSLVPRGQARGLTWFQPGEDVALVSRAQMFARMVGALGGRAAEEVVFGHEEVTSGATGDLQQVAAMARQMVLQYGMSDIGPWALQQSGGMSDALRQRVDAAVRSMAQEAYAAALDHVRQHRSALDALAQALLEREALSGEEFRSLLSQHAAIPQENLAAVVQPGSAAASASERLDL